MSLAPRPIAPASALVVGFFAWPAFAQLSITWYTIDSGGGTSANGTFSLSATIGQHDAGPRMIGGQFSLVGGFWTGAPAPPRCVADFDDGSGSGTPDGGVTIDDLLYYLQLYADGLIAADIDDGSMTNTPDGGVTIDDLLYYVRRYVDGC